MRVNLGSGRGWLLAPAAASIRRIDAELGHPLQITEAGRTWPQQKVHWDTYQRNGRPIALHPDTPSIHQLGGAIDSDEAQRFISLMTRHGWKRTVYRGGKLVEPWHFEYFPDTDQHRNDTEEDVVTPEQSKWLEACYNALFGPENTGRKKMTWATPDGPREAYYGVLDIVIYNQQLIKAQSAALQALATAQGADPKAITEAVERAVHEAMGDVTFSASVRE